MNRNLAIDGAELNRHELPRRELVSLLAYVETGSHKGAAHRLGISESTSRHRLSQLMARIGARNAGQAAWRLRMQLDAHRRGDW